MPEPKREVDTWVIVNPAAGGGRCGRRFEAQRARFAGPQFAIRFTHAGGDATELARAGMTAGIRRFWAVGGDGTLFEVINGLLPAALTTPVTLSILPCGTGNSFLRDLTDRQGEHTVDVVRVSHSEGELYSINLCTLGFSAKVGALTNRWFKPLGAFGYTVAVLLGLVGLRRNRLRLRADDEPWADIEHTLIAFCNSRYTGGSMQMAPAAKIDDGCLDLIHIGALSRWRLIRAFPRLFKGTHIALAEVKATTARKIALDLAGACDVLVDGEIFHLHLTELEVLPAALKLQI
jgi:diacylglycerol kinase family enzyme